MSSNKICEKHAVSKKVFGSLFVYYPSAKKVTYDIIFVKLDQLLALVYLAVLLPVATGKRVPVIREKTVAILRDKIGFVYRIKCVCICVARAA